MHQSTFSYPIYEIIVYLKDIIEHKPEAVADLMLVYILPKLTVVSTVQEAAPHPFCSKFFISYQFFFCFLRGK